MKREEIYSKFIEMFPDLAGAVKSYKKTGSRMISMTMKNEKSLVFMWTSMDDWSLGTKIWRWKPDNMVDMGTTIDGKKIKEVSKC